jgi:lipid-binding SYLF domain-containing protein
LKQAAETVAWFENNVNGLPAQIEQSAGYVVFPDVARWGIILTGGTFGRGVLCKPNGEQIGWAAINAGSIGLQAGVKGFRMLLVLQDDETLRRFKANQLAGSVTGVAVLGRAGGTGTGQFNRGVVIYEGASAGLMAGVNIGLNYIRFEPMAKDEKPGDTR